MLARRSLQMRFSTGSTQRRRSPTPLHMRSFRTERTNSLFAADVVSSACVYVPSLLKFSKTTGAQSTDGHDEVLRPGMASHPLRTAGSSKGTILPLPDRLRPRSTAKSRPNLSGKSRSQRGFQARDPSRRRTFPTGCETRLSPASPQRSRGPSRRRPLHIVARFCAQRRQRSQGSRGGR